MKYVCPHCGATYETAGRCRADGVAAIASDDELLGQMVGSYRIARLIGQGGMGRVYRAVHPAIGSRVAIKVLTDRRRELVQRFFDEARAVNVIRHEQIVNVLDLAWLPDGRPYIVMEYLEGQPLSALLREKGPMPLAPLGHLMGQILGALGAAHRHRIIHRDLKPDNVFLTAGGSVKVLDFGIAKLDPGLGAAGMSTASGALLGTPHYMSPEQASGKGVDARSDLFSIGVILYEAATGKLPFQADSLFTLLRLIVEAPAPPPRALRPELPVALEAVILRALAKDPAQRFATAAEMAGAVADAVRAPPGRASEPEPTPPKPSRLGPIAVAISIGVLGVVVAARVIDWKDASRGGAARGAGVAPVPRNAPTPPPMPSVARQTEAKLRAFIECLNRIAADVTRDRDWYYSWVDRRTGPTGSERFIRGVGGLTYDAKPCADGVAAARSQPPPLPDLEEEGVRYAAAATSLHSLEAEADDYYRREDYKDDRMKKGAQLHPRLVAAWEDFGRSERRLRKLVTAKDLEAHRAILAELEAAEGRRLRYRGQSLMLAGEALVTALNVPGRDLLRIDAAKATALLDDFKRELDEFSAYLRQHPEEPEQTYGPALTLRGVPSNGAAVYDTAKKLLRRVREKRPYPADELRDLSVALDSPWNLIAQYDDFLGRASEELGYAAVRPERR